MDSTISEAARKCLEAYRHVQNLVADQPLLHRRVTDQLQNINSWIYNTSVYGEPHTSLDYRVGDAEHIRSLFVQLLHAIGSLGIEGTYHAIALLEVAHEAHQTKPGMTPM